MANLFGNPSLSATPPISALSPMGSPMPNLPSASFLPASNPLGSNPLGASLMPQLATPKTPLVTATPVQFTPSPQLQASVQPRLPVPAAAAPLTFSQQPLPLVAANQSTSPRGATSGKRNVKSGRRQNSEIVAPTPVEMDIATTEPPKKGWGYVFSPLNIIFLILVFIIVFITLYCSKLNLVTNLEDGHRVMNNKKLILWSVVITIIVAIVGFFTMSAVAKRRK